MLVDLHQLDRKYESLKVRSRDEEAKLLASLEKDGQRTPIVVVRCESDARPYVVIDGFKRVRAAKRLGLDQVACSAWDGDEVAGLVQLHHLQRPRPRSGLEDGYLIRTLQEEHGLTLREIGRRLGRTKSWVSRRLGLVRDLPEWLQEYIWNGDLQCYAATKYLLPLARANTGHAKLLATELAGMKVTTREVADLYYAWKNAGDEERLTVVSYPDKVLAARRVECAVADGDAAVEAVLGDLAMAESVVRRALRRAGDLPEGQLERWQRDSLRLRMRRVWEAMTPLDKRLEELHEDPGSRDSTSDSAVA